MAEFKESLDPLRSFELDVKDWEHIVDVVKTEGYEEWDGFAPAIVAAIELGYMDNHLQMLGKWLRSRWLYLKDNDNLPDIYQPGTNGNNASSVAPTKTVASPQPDGTWTDYAAAIEAVTNRGEMIPDEGIKPLRPYDPNTALRRGTFAAKRHVFFKADFIGKYFIAPVPVKPGALYRIDKVANTNFQVTCVASAIGSHLGRTYNFRIESQYRFYNLG